MASPNQRAVSSRTPLVWTVWSVIFLFCVLVWLASSTAVMHPLVVTKPSAAAASSALDKRRRVPRADDESGDADVSSSSSSSGSRGEEANTPAARGGVNKKARRKKAAGADVDDEDGADNDHDAPLLASSSRVRRRNTAEGGSGSPSGSTRPQPAMARAGLTPAPLPDDLDDDDGGDAAVSVARSHNNHPWQQPHLTRAPSAIWDPAAAENHAAVNLIRDRQQMLERLREGRRKGRRHAAEVHAGGVAHHGDHHPGNIAFPGDADALPVLLPGHESHQQIQEKLQQIHAEQMQQMQHRLQSNQQKLERDLQQHQFAAHQLQQEPQLQPQDGVHGAAVENNDHHHARAAALALQIESHGNIHVRATPRDHREMLRYMEEHPATLPIQTSLIEATRRELTSLLDHAWGTRPTVLLWYDDHCLGPQGMCAELTTAMLGAAASERLRKVGDVVFARADARLYPELFEPLGIAILPGLMFLLPLDNRGHHHHHHMDEIPQGGGGNGDGIFAAGAGGEVVAAVPGRSAGTALLSPHLNAHGLVLELESQMQRWIQFVAP